MVVIIADDLSGAAELAGVARGAGLRAEVQTRFDPATPADVVAVDTDSRTMAEGDAVARVREVTERVMAARPDWIYKKTDSVLRGHVAAECRTVAEVAGLSRVLLVPANPNRRRIIRHGRYEVEGVPLDRSPFAADPQWPARTADVERLLRSEGGTVRALRHDEPLPGRGIGIPDVWEAAQLRDRAREVDGSVLAAGASEFFTMLLRRAPVAARPIPEMTARSELTLFVCGSHAAWSGGRLRECQRHAVPFVPMPRRVFADDHAADEIVDWASLASDALAVTGSAMLSVGGEKIPGLPGGLLEGRLADAARRVLGRVTVGHLLLEGGATAAAVLRECGWNRLRVGREVAPGLAWMEVVDAPAPLLLIKPGSYPWPAAVWGR